MIGCRPEMAFHPLVIADAADVMARAAAPAGPYFAGTTFSRLLKFATT